MTDFNEAFKNMLMCNTTFEQMVAEFKSWVDPQITVPAHLTGLHVLIFRNNVLKPNEKIQLAKIIADYGAMPVATHMKKIVLPTTSAKIYKPLIIYYCDLGVPPNCGKYSWEDLEPIIMESRDPIATAFNIAQNMLINGRLPHDMESGTFAELMRRFSLNTDELHMNSREVLKQLTLDQVANNPQVIDRLNLSSMRSYVFTVLAAVGASSAAKVKIIDYIWTKESGVFHDAPKSNIRNLCDKFKEQGLYQFLEKYLVFGSSAPYGPQKICARIASGRILVQENQYSVIDRVICAANIPTSDLQSFRVTFKSCKDKLAAATIAKLWV